MAYSYAITAGDGSNDLVNVPFPYITKGHVHVSVDGVLVADEDLTWNSPSQIELPSAPANEAVIRVYRETPITSLLVVFSSGALNSVDLNRLGTHLLYVVQEGMDKSENAEDVANGVAASVQGLVQAAIDELGEAMVEAQQIVAQIAILQAALQAAVLAAEAGQTGAEAAQAAAEAAQAAAEAAAGSIDVEALLTKAGNLAGLADAGEARDNLGLAAGATMAKASAANVRAAADDVAVTPASAYAAQAPVTLTDSSTIALDFATFDNAEVTIAGNRTFGDPSNEANVIGKKGWIRVTASGGTRTITKHADMKCVSGVWGSAISIANGQSIYIYYEVVASNNIQILAIRENPS